MRNFIVLLLLLRFEAGYAEECKIVASDWRAADCEALDEKIDDIEKLSSHGRFLEIKEDNCSDPHFDALVRLQEIMRALSGRNDNLQSLVRSSKEACEAANKQTAPSANDDCSLAASFRDNLEMLSSFGKYQHGTLLQLESLLSQANRERGASIEAACAESGDKRAWCRIRTALLELKNTCEANNKSGAQYAELERQLLNKSGNSQSNVAAAVKNEQSTTSTIVDSGSKKVGAKATAATATSKQLAKTQAKRTKEQTKKAKLEPMFAAGWDKDLPKVTTRRSQGAAGKSTAGASVDGSSCTPGSTATTSSNVPFASRLLSKPRICPRQDPFVNIFHVPDRDGGYPLYTGGAMTRSDWTNVYQHIGHLGPYDLLRYSDVRDTLWDGTDKVPFEVAQAMGRATGGGFFRLPSGGDQDTARRLYNDPIGLNITHWIHDDEHEERTQEWLQRVKQWYVTENLEARRRAGKPAPLLITNWETNNAGYNNAVGGLAGMRAIGFTAGNWQYYSYRTDSGADVLYEILVKRAETSTERFGTTVRDSVDSTWQFGGSYIGIASDNGNPTPLAAEEWASVIALGTLEGMRSYFAFTPQSDGTLSLPSLSSSEKGIFNADAFYAMAKAASWFESTKNSFKNSIYTGPETNEDPVQNKSSNVYVKSRKNKTTGEQWFAGVAWSSSASVTLTLSAPRGTFTNLATGVAQSISNGTATIQLARTNNMRVSELYHFAPTGVTPPSSGGSGSSGGSNPSPNPTPTPSASPTPSPTPSATPTAQPTQQPAPIPSSTPSPTASATPAPSTGSKVIFNCLNSGGNIVGIAIKNLAGQEIAVITLPKANGNAYPTTATLSVNVESGWAGNVKTISPYRIQAPNTRILATKIKWSALGVAVEDGKDRDYNEPVCSWVIGTASGGSGGDSTTTSGPVNGLLGLWALEGNATDTSGKGNNGTIKGNPSTVAGKFGNAMSFDGFDDFATLNAAGAGGLGPNSTSFSLWVNPDQLSGQIAVHRKTSWNGWGIRSDKDDTWFYYTGDDASNDTGCSFGGTLALGTWTHLAVVVDRSGGFYRCHRNGVSTGTGSIHHSALNNSDPIYLAARGAVPDYFFKGKIDDVRLYNRALSTSEVSAVFSGTDGASAGSSSGGASSGSSSSAGNSSQTSSSAAGSSGGANPSPTPTPTVAQSPSTPACSTGPSTATSNVPFASRLLSKPSICPKQDPFVTVFHVPDRQGGYPFVTGADMTRTDWTNVYGHVGHIGPYELLRLGDVRESLWDSTDKVPFEVAQGMGRATGGGFMWYVPSGSDQDTVRRLYKDPIGLNITHWIHDNEHEDRTRDWLQRAKQWYVDELLSARRAVGKPAPLLITNWETNNAGYNDVTGGLAGMRSIGFTAGNRQYYSYRTDGGADVLNEMFVGTRERAITRFGETIMSAFDDTSKFGGAYIGIANDNGPAVPLAAEEWASVITMGTLEGMRSYFVFTPQSDGTLSSKNASTNDQANFNADAFYAMAKAASWFESTKNSFKDSVYTGHESGQKDPVQNKSSNVYVVSRKNETTREQWFAGVAWSGSASVTLTLSAPSGTLTNLSTGVAKSVSGGTTTIQLARTNNSRVSELYHFAPTGATATVTSNASPVGNSTGGSGVTIGGSAGGGSRSKPALK